MHTNRLLNAAAFVLAAAAAFATFGGSALLAKRSFETAERVAQVPTLAPQYVVVVAHRPRRA